MRSVREFKLAIVLGAFVVSIGALSASALAAPSFTLTTSTSTTQAAAPTDLSYTFASSSSERLTELSVSMPEGVMHDPSAASVCSIALFEADRCPARSRVGTVAMQLVALGVRVDVPGTTYHLDLPGDTAAVTFGTVLRPPFSSLGLVAKSRAGHRILFDDRGGITETTRGLPDRISTFLGSVPARVSRFSMRYDGVNAIGNLLHNSTSCPTDRPFRATASFSDGSSLVRTSPYSTTGCPAVPLTSSASITLDEPAAQRTSFAILLNPGRDAARGELHDSHVKSVEADLSELGTFDTEMLAAMPGCPEDLALRLRCGEASRVGSFSTAVEGLTGQLTGDLHRTTESSSGIVGVLDLPGDRVAGFKIEIDGVPQSSKGVKLSVPVQLPLEATVVKIDAPILKLHGKPASCSNRETRAVLSGHSGGWSVWGDDNGSVACPPAVSFSNPGDADADGDGFADDSLKPENFSVQYDVTDGGNGIDPESARCELESPDPSTAVRGKVKDIRNTGGNFACEVSEAAGDVTVVFSVASLDGHVTVLKSSYNVDSEAPVVESEASEVIDFDSTNISLEFTFTDDRLAHPQSTYDIECVIEDSSGQRHTTSPGHKYIDTLTLRGGGECMWDTGRSGRFRLEVVVRDAGGHVTVLKRTAVVDAQGPVITLTDWRDQDDDGDGLPTEAIRVSAFDVPFSVSDDSGVDPASISCKLINPVAMDKDLRVADFDGDGAPDVCQVTEAPGGPIAVEISAADWRGHVTVLKAAYTVDTEGPVFTTAPDKVVYDIASFDYEFEFTDDTHDHPQSKIKPGAEIETKTGATIESAKIIVDRDTGRSKGFARFENVPDGDHELTLSLEDSTGHVTVLKRSFTVDTQGPTIRVTQGDDDGDGVFDEAFQSPDFEVPFDVTDQSDIDPASAECQVRDYNWRVAARPSRPDGGVDQTPAFYCPVSGFPDGPFELEISAADVHGHVTVLKVAGEVDSTPPPLTLHSPTDGQTFSTGSSITPVFTIEGEGPYTFRCLIDSFVVSNSCASGSSISLAGIEPGTFVFSVVARDGSGRESVASAQISISSPPGGGTCVVIPGLPPNCDDTIVCPVTSNIPGCPYGPITCIAIVPAPPGCPGGPPTTACPPPQNVNPPVGCPIYGTVPGGGITVP